MAGPRSNSAPYPFRCLGFIACAGADLCQAGRSGAGRVRQRGPGMRKLLPLAAVAAILAAGGPAQADTKELLGTIIGAAGGGYAGSHLGRGKGRLAATAVGTLAGALFGNGIGGSLDRADSVWAGQAQAAPSQAYYPAPPPAYYPPPPVVVAYPAPPAYAPPRVVYAQPRPGVIHATPVRDGYDTGGNYCREYTATVLVGGMPQQSYGTACLMPDGSWNIVR